MTPQVAAAQATAELVAISATGFAVLVLACWLVSVGRFNRQHRALLGMSYGCAMALQQARQEVIDQQKIIDALVDVLQTTEPTERTWEAITMANALTPHDFHITTGDVEDLGD